MKEKIIFVIKFGNEILHCQTLDDLNNTLVHLEENFIKNVENDLLIKEISKEEFITYKNEIGIQVKGNVKNYKITENLIEYILRLSLLNRNNGSVWGEEKENGDIECIFYIKKLKVLKYLFDNIQSQMIVSLLILRQIRDIDV